MVVVDEGGSVVFVLCAETAAEIEVGGEPSGALGLEQDVSGKVVFTTSGATLVLSMWEPTMTPALLPWPPFADGGAWKADTSIRMPRRF